MLPGLVDDTLGALDCLSRPAYTACAGHVFRRMVGPDVSDAVIATVIEDFMEDGAEYCENDDQTLTFLLSREDHVKVDAFLEYTVPQFTDARFRRAFRVPRSVFAYLLDNLSNSLIDPPHFGGRQPVTPEKKSAMFLKRVATKETTLDISQLFGVSEFSFIKAMRQVTDAILDNLLDTIIQWPKVEEYQSIAAEFDAVDNLNFPNVVGALDGSHIPISTPLVNPNSFYNRKKVHSVVMQAVCRKDMRFTDICVGMPGRMHDARVLRNSDLWNTGILKSRQGQYHILADAAYPLSSWLMTPYRNNGHLTNQQRNYNTALSRRREVVERAFGMMKRRFRRLQIGIDMINMDEINKLVLACCVLHNVCILQNDISDFEDEEEFVDNRYSILLRNEQEEPDDVIVPNNPEEEGRIKRIVITNNL